jgi:small nuclear ribonucleoprotein D2
VEPHTPPLINSHAQLLHLLSAHSSCVIARLLGLLLLQIPKTGKGAKASRPVNRDRFISKMFLRGDSVILVLRNPK